ncbi:hypothetical protein [Reyranella sp. CPCC 100927]|uniref:hypothetical protein n=1 Tax=Reyranella sp. CPCC 100927 TaxID=2599616 RepID=UPI0011B48963|nr:hypothetical protein [Reyranella sp. CPCC 100927]TWT14888.1 hypothetical protein FQU96_00535 [Reyranella sp. CPCC 100927]
MADDRRRVPPGGRPSRQSSQNAREERPFDLWLNRQLHAMYDDIAHEPLPPDVVDLIEADGRRAAAEKTAQTPETSDPPMTAEPSGSDKS